MIFCKYPNNVLTQYARRNDHKFDYVNEGIAHRKRIIADRIRYIGKETNNLDEVEITGLDEEDYLEYTKDHETVNSKEFLDWVLTLKPKDFDFQNNIVRMITLKKRKESYRVIPIHMELKTAIMEYLLEEHLDPRSDQKLFPMKRQSVDEYFKKMQSELGFRIHAHKFRHTFAVRTIMSGVPLNVLQKWLEHSSVFMTSVYTEIMGMDTRMFMEQVK
jgi:hypothetical protein